MKVGNTEIVVLDFETTGAVDGYSSEPWQVGMVRFEHGKSQSDEVLESLIRVGDRPFNPQAPGKHHALREEIAVAPTMHELWTTLASWLEGRPLAAHNIATEKAVLNQAAPMHKLGPWIDTLKLARIAYPDLPSHKLEDLLMTLELQPKVDELCPGRESHDALYDAIACAVLLEHLLGLQGWEQLSVEALSLAHPSDFYALRQARKHS